MATAAGVHGSETGRTLEGSPARDDARAGGIVSGYSAQARDPLLAYSVEAGASSLSAYTARAEWTEDPPVAPQAEAFLAVAAPEPMPLIFAEALPSLLRGSGMDRSLAGAFMAQVGRQSARSGPLLGRYDGLMVSTPLGAGARLNLLGGFAVDSSSQDRMSGDRSFYAVSVDLAPGRSDITGQIFGTRERIDAVRQRSSFGAALGFNRERGFGFAAADYDVNTRELDTAMLVAVARLDDRTALKAFADLRRNASPTAYKTTQGKPLQSVGQLLDTLAQSDIRKAALDRGAERRSVTLGASRQLQPGVLLSADVTLRDQQSGARTQRNGELGYALAATWTDPSAPLRYTTAALQLIESAALRSYVGSVGGYYPISESLGIGPDLSLQYSGTGRSDSSRTYRPSLRLEYLKTALRLDVQLGLELSDGEAGAHGYFYSLGYQGTF